MNARKLKHKAFWMLIELQSQHLEVVLVPSREYEWIIRGWKVRCVQESNCEWYRKFCEQFPSRRTRPRHKKKFDTLIKRRETIAALEQISEGTIHGLYVGRLIDFIESEQRARVRNYLLTRQHRYEYAA
jgi:hypothetical protein